MCVWKVNVLGWAVFYLFWFSQTGSFSVTDPFLTAFYYVEKQNGILRKKRREEFENSYVSLHADRGVKNCQNHPYVINEWPLTHSKYGIWRQEPVQEETNKAKLIRICSLFNHLLLHTDQPCGLADYVSHRWSLTFRVHMFSILL